MSARFIGFDDPPAPPKSYTQEEFDSHMAGMRKKYETREAELKNAQKALAAELETQKKTKGLSAEERATLETRIQELESQYLTEQEKTARQVAQEKETYTKQVGDLSSERDSWRRNYQDEVVTTAISRAARINEAFEDEQVEAILRPMIGWKDVVGDDGQPTGKVVPIVKFPDADTKTKQPIVMEFTVAEAVKRMKEIDKYGNLFKGTSKPGVGGHGNAGTSKKIDAAKLAKENPAEYRRLRKESPEALYRSVGN